LLLGSLTRRTLGDSEDTGTTGFDPVEEGGGDCSLEGEAEIFFEGIVN
jgi:hypothetical protein